MVTIEYSKAIAEVLYILENTEEEIVLKIPENVLNFLRENASNEYKPELEYRQDIRDMNLKDKTKAILAAIYRDYLASEEEREEYNKTLMENENRYQEKIRENYNRDEMFKNNQKESANIENLPAEIKQKNFFQKIIDYIKKIGK